MIKELLIYLKLLVLNQNVVNLKGDYMSNATKIIKANNLEQLSVKIEDMDIFSLMRITTKGIYLSRRECFLLMYNHSKKFLDDPRYQESYLPFVIDHAAVNNNLYVLELILNDKDVQMDQKYLDSLLLQSIEHYRIFYYLIKSYTFNESILYEALGLLIKNQRSKSIKLIYKKIDLLFKFAKYDGEKLISTLKKVNYHRRSEKYSHDDKLNFPCFLKKYDKTRYYLKNLSSFEYFMREEELAEYKQLLIQNKVINF